MRDFQIFVKVIGKGSNPPGSLTHPAHSPKYQYFIYPYPFEGVRFGH